MANLLSIITFIPLVAAAILALLLRGDDEAAARQADPGEEPADEGPGPVVGGQRLHHAHEVSTTPSRSPQEIQTASFQVKFSEAQRS